MDKINHYSIENPATCYDEESLTVLQLCGRLAAKVNECVGEFNRHVEKVVDKLAEQDKAIAEGFSSKMVEHVNDWLDAHPEATTTVQPGSLGLGHFQHDTLLHIENSYITPVMCGAVGDGVTDDSAAFERMFTDFAGHKAFIPAGTYKITRPLVAHNSVYGETGSKILFYPENGGTAITVAGERTQLCADAACSITDKIMVVEGFNFSDQVKPGDRLYMDAGVKASAYARDYNTKQDMLEVESISGNTVTFTTVPEWPEITSVSLWRMDFVDDIEIANLNIECMGMREWSSGILLENVHNAHIHHCSVRNFDYGQIDVRYAADVHIHDNYCAVNYADELQYGILLSYVYGGTVHGNTVNSERTAIDVSYGSQYVTVSGNTTRGNVNTHWAINCIISGNTVNSGVILLRGKKLAVLHNYVTQYEGNISAIDIMEGGNEGGHVIQGNTVYGVICIKAVMSGTRIIGNTFKASVCPVYYDTETAMIRISSAADSATPDVGVEISGNHLEYMGDGRIKYGVDLYYNTDENTHNVRIANNVIRNAVTGIYAVPRSFDDAAPCENLTIVGNDLQNVEVGIGFGRMNNTIISNNQIESAKTGGTRGIHRISVTQNVRGLSITGNLIEGFNEGLRIYDNDGVIYDSVIANNCYVNCTTRHTVSKEKVIPQAAEFAGIVGDDGNRYILSVVDGAVSATLQLEK